MHGKYNARDTKTICGKTPDTNNPFTIYIWNLRCKECADILRANIIEMKRLQQESNANAPDSCDPCD